MPPIRTAVEDMPLAERLLNGLRYPLRGGALAACITLGLCHYVVLLPSFVGLIAVVIVWIATLRYAIDCLAATAGGCDDPPEVQVESPSGNPPGIFILHAFAVLACVATAAFAPAWLWLALGAAALLLPAINMSLAFDGDLGVALNPLTWVQVIARFGAAYLIPVLANAGLVATIMLARNSIAMLPLALSLPVFGFVCTWLAILDFHWMGALVWHYRERLGMGPEASTVAARLEANPDEQLLAECATIARHDPEEAAIRLRDRIHERYAPGVVHARFRELLRKLDRKDLLIKHGQDWIAQLCTSGDDRRALGVVQECRGIEARFLPDDPGHAVLLAKAAARLGMHELAWHLANGFVQRWPRHAAAPELQLLAAPPRTGT